MALRAAGVTETGPVRRTNEDCFACEHDLRLFVVADGMGGHAAGEIAAQVAVESIVNFIRRSHDTSDFSWPYGVDATLSYDGNRLKTAVLLANRRINRMAESHDDYLGMGTTAVCALLSETQLTIAHVGDSRLYLFDGRDLHTLTEDDTWAATVLGSRAAQAGAAIRHVLTNVLGARLDTQVHLAERVRHDHETLLLCSDGLHGAVSHEQIAAILAQPGEPHEQAQRLVEAALACGSRDNITALVISCAE